MLNVPAVRQVHLMFYARLLNTEFAPGPETIEARLFAEDEVPWNALAFNVVRVNVENFFADLRGGVRSIRIGTVEHAQIQSVRDDFPSR